MDTLTQRQAEILRFIRDTLARDELPPTRAEIAKALGFRSLNAAEGHLKALARKGAIELIPGSSRGIRLRQPAGLSVVGRVAAGSPILAEEHIETQIQLDPALFTPKADYLLRVRGMSMRDAGILDGDLLAVHRTQDIHNGQIVVARLEQEVTVKRFKRIDNKVWLLSENKDFSPIEIDLNRQSLEIEGIGVGVIRTTPS
jgi:repressor LexA